MIIPKVSVGWGKGVRLWSFTRFQVFYQPIKIILFESIISTLCNQKPRVVYIIYVLIICLHNVLRFSWRHMILSPRLHLMSFLLIYYKHYRNSQFFFFGCIMVWRRNSSRNLVVNLTPNTVAEACTEQISPCSVWCPDTLPQRWARSRVPLGWFRRRTLSSDRHFRPPE